MNGARESTGQSSAARSASSSKAGRRTLLGVFLIGLGLLIVQVFNPAFLPLPAGMLDTIVLFFAVASTLASLSGNLPAQNVLLATIIIGVIGGGIQLLGALTAIPFGPVVYTRDAGPQLFSSMSWAMPFIWIIAIQTARGVGRLILRPWRKIRVYGFWLIGLTTVLTLLFDLGLEPYATRFKHYWLWHPTKLPVDWYGAPVSNFLGWLVTSLLILAFATPSLMKKKPIKSGRDYHPLIVWVSLNLLFIAGALSGHLWAAVAVSGVACVLVAAFAIHGARW
jgi:uncharacterized membrane protein